MFHSKLFVFSFFHLICFNSLYFASSNQNSFWRTQISTLLSIDKREHGILRLVTSEESTKSESDEDERLEIFNGSKLVELVVTNDDGVEVTLFVSKDIYKAMYGEVVVRKNPQTFGTRNEFDLSEKVESNDPLVVSHESRIKTYVIKKHHFHGKQTNVSMPIFPMLGFEGIRILNNVTDSSCYMRLNTSTSTDNTTASNSNYTCNPCVPLSAPKND
ncbi:hypothetical protein FG379_003429 [Cryptosporidium bovis]|uniref:uncharacterized protein n=1 Tax=Cryptosporidium bovis TaxID=310047 RepID=UPI00351A3DB7|nr:hypothetical protein FG379_003429 [Cryptosporidium bovis]